MKKLHLHVLLVDGNQGDSCPRYFQHAHFVPIVGVGKRGVYSRKIKSHYVRDEEGRLQRDKGRIRERWVRLFCSLFNAKPDMLDPDIP